MTEPTDTLIGEEGAIEVFCKYIRKNGKIIHPKKAKAFHFFFKPKKKKTTQE